MKMIKVYTIIITRIIILFAMLMGIISHARSQNVNLKTFGGINNDEMHAMTRSHDGGFIMAGSTESYGDGNFGNTDTYLIKTDSDENIIWSKTIGLEVYDDIFSIEPTNDSAYVICGIASDNNTSIGILLAKFNENGDIIWQKVFEKDHAGIGYCIHQTTDNGFIVAAEILQNDNLDFLLIKIDAAGTVHWSKKIGSPDPEVPSSIIQTTDGGYLVCGTSRQNSATIPVYIVKTDSLGTVEWQKTYSTSPEFSRSTVSSVIATKDGGYVLAGGNTHNELFSDIILMKINESGEVQWVNAFGGIADEYCGNMIQDADGNFVVCGSSASSESDNFDALLLKIDSSGDLITAALFGTTLADDAFVSILPRADGSYLLGGNTSSFSPFLFSDFMMMHVSNNFNGPACDKLAPNILQTPVAFGEETNFAESDVNVSGNNVLPSIDSGVNDSLLCDLATGEGTPSASGNELLIYPNPAMNLLIIEGDHYEAATIEIFNTLGEKVFSVPFSSSLNIVTLATGCYFIQTLNKQGMISARGKFVKK